MSNEKGQALLENLFILPVILGVFLSSLILAIYYTSLYIQDYAAHEFLICYHSSQDMENCSSQFYKQTQLFSPYVVSEIKHVKRIQSLIRIEYTNQLHFKTLWKHPLFVVKRSIVMEKPKKSSQISRELK